MVAGGASLAEANSPWFRCALCALTSALEPELSQASRARVDAPGAAGRASPRESTEEKSWRCFGAALNLGRRSWDQNSRPLARWPEAVCAWFLVFRISKAWAARSGLVENSKQPCPLELDCAGRLRWSFDQSSIGTLPWHGGSAPRRSRDVLHCSRTDCSGRLLTRTGRSDLVQHSRR